jgi:hypothetical protein
MSHEPDARILIDRLLCEAVWDIEDKAQVSTEESALGLIDSCDGRVVERQWLTSIQ